MKRSWVKEILIVVLLVVAVLGTVFTIRGTIQRSNWYGMTAVVTHVSQANDTVTIKDFNGNLWQFKGAEDWSVDDVVACIMDNKGTELIKDDAIVSVRYSGYFEGWGN